MSKSHTGTVVKSTGSWYNVRMDDTQEIIPCRIKGKFRLQGLKLTNPVAVGDRVDVEIDGEDCTIHNIHDRSNYVVRQSPRKKHHLHLLASNVDQAILVVTIVQPKLKQGFIDRFLLMTEPYDIPVTIVFNKSDVYTENDFLIYEYMQAIYENLSYDCLLISVFKNEGIEELRKILTNKTSLISGQSGVGKSTLINALLGQEIIPTSEISDYNGKGQHTTTFAEMYQLGPDSYIIDTPGIKTLSFNHLEEQDITHNFREMFHLSKQCRFSDCSHRNEPKCAVKKALEEGRISELRYNNYLLLLQEVEDQNYWERHSDM